MKTPVKSTLFAQNHIIYDVIIAGAGPVGLFLACELALARCSVLILEKAKNPESVLKKLPFGIRGLSSLSIETLYRRGLLNELDLHKHIKSPHQHAGKGTSRQIGHFAGIPLYEGDIDPSQWPYRLPDSTETSLISEIDELEKILTHRAVTLGVTIKREMPVTDFQQTEEGVIVWSENHIYAGKWLVGCDGSRSVIRKKGGFEFAGTEPEFTGYTTQLDIADPEKLKSGRNMTSTGMYVQSQPGYVLMQEFDGGAFHDSGKALTSEYIQALLRRVSETDVTVNALHLATTWTDRARQATRYRNGRILLAGDAAHIHSPLGGQGLNLGLGDAMNLGWKLASTIRNQAPESLLDSYHTERHPVGVQVLDWSRAQVAAMKPTPEARALNAIIADLIHTPNGATYIAGRIWGLYTKYDLGYEHPIIGRSVPDFELEDGSRIGTLMHSGQGLLLDFAVNDSLKSLAEIYQPQIKYVAGKAKEQMGLSTVLVRPDGIIAWVCENTPSNDELAKVMARWFVATHK